MTVKFILTHKVARSFYRVGGFQWLFLPHSPTPFTDILKHPYTILHENLWIIQHYLHFHLLYIIVLHPIIQPASRENMSTVYSRLSLSVGGYLDVVWVFVTTDISSLLCQTNFPFIIIKFILPNSAQQNDNVWQDEGETCSVNCEIKDNSMVRSLMTAFKCCCFIFM